MTFIAFSATTRMSGVDYDSRVIRKGADDSMALWSGKDLPADVRTRVDGIGRSGGTPLVVGENKVILGTIHPPVGIVLFVTSRIASGLPYTRCDPTDPGSIGVIGGNGATGACGSA